MFQTDVRLTNLQEYQAEYTIQQINKRVNVFLLLQFKDVPKFLLFGPESETGKFDHQSKHNDFNNIIYKMATHTQTIRRQIADELFECVWPFVNLALKGLKSFSSNVIIFLPETHLMLT